MVRASSASCTFLTGGDVAPDREKGKGLFGRLAPLFRDAGYSFLNLEHTLSRSGRLVAGKGFFHRGAPEMAEGLTEAGLDALSIANNHIMDYGEEAFFETLGVLEANSLPAAGAGRSLREARRPVILERGGLRVGLLAYSTTLPQGFAAGPRSPGVNPLRVKTAYRQQLSHDEYPGTAPQVLTSAVPEDLRRMRRDIRALARRADVVLVYQHWGTSMIHGVHDFQREIGRAAIDAGAHAVFGGHQHVLSAVEFHRGRPIVHCTGNLIFDKAEPFFTSATRQTFLFGGTLTKRGVVDPYIVPCRCGVKEPPALLSLHRGEGREIVQMMERLCAPFGARLAPKSDRVSLFPPDG
ncbi:MAG: CapA family protein [bacterium]